jgi:hypothetical protein
MPDELDALRQFRDETPRPSTDAWNRARAAIAAARAEEQPAGRVPGQRSPGWRPGQRRVLWMVTAGAVAAAVALLLAVLLPGPGGRTGAPIETTAFVTHVEHALSGAGQRDLVGYARAVYPAGVSIDPHADGMQVSLGQAIGSPWNVRSVVQWSYQGASRMSAFTATGRPVFDLGTAARGAVTGVFYRTGTWWRTTTGPPPAAGKPPVAGACGPGIQLGPGGWPAFIRGELGCGGFGKGGRQRVDGIDASKLTGYGGREVFWVNPATYLPVRVVIAYAGWRVQTDFRWLAATPARLAELHVPVPPGFRRVAPPGRVSGK